MIELTAEAKKRLNDYLQRTRAALAGSRTFEATEVEQNVREHVEVALEGAPGPVSAERLGEVLAQLGPPDRWLTDDDRPGWRRVLQRISTGPEDWRLAYLTFGLFALGLLLLPVGIGVFLFLPAFFLARAEADLLAARGDDLGARRWLVLPAIWLVLLTVAGVALIAPVIAIASIGISDGHIHLVGGIPHTQPETLERMRVEAGFLGLVAGAWWLVLAPIFALLVNPLRRLFFPVTENLGRKHAALLALIGAMVAAIGAVLLFAVR